MLPRRVLRASISRNVPRKPHHHHQTRPTSTTATRTTHASRLSRLESKLPRFLQRYTLPLRTAPVSHITSFLLLHELTAILPLFGLAALFHYTNWLPPYISEGKWVKEGMAKMGRWFRRKGWLDEEGGGTVWWGRGEGGLRWVVELATAWAITKALLPARLVFSVWATPWFARTTLLPVWGAAKRMFAKKGAVGSVGGVGLSPAAGTNAVGGRVGPVSGKLGK